MIAEVNAMAAHAVASGLAVPARDVQAVLALQRRTLPLDEAGLAGLAATHENLRRVVAPATPRTLSILASEAKRRSSGFLALGPIPIIRYLTVAGLVFLVALIGLGLSPDVNREAGGILDSSGTTLLLNLLFVLSAAGLGAVFAAMFRVNRHVAAGTYDPHFEATYWISIVLGLIAGLVLAELIPEAFEGETSAEFSLARPVLALIGGFSATVVFRILQRLVDAVESVFRGSSEELVTSQIEAARARLAVQQAEDRIRLSSRLVRLQQTLKDGVTVGDVDEALSGILDDLMPGRAAATPPPADFKPAPAPPPPPPDTEASG